MSDQADSEGTPGIPILRAPLQFMMEVYLASADYSQQGSPGDTPVSAIAVIYSATKNSNYNYRTVTHTNHSTVVKQETEYPPAT